MEITVYQAPLQGFTDFVYRKVFDEIFREPDTFFIPYILIKNGELPKKYISEILPVNNPQKKVIPQVLAGNCNELIIQSEILENYGYIEINLNLGCPYPMVTNQKKGSGLLPFPGEIHKMLDGFFSKSNLKLSVKLRAGLNNPEEIKQIIPVLNEFPLSEVILHPRIAKQLYKGDIFEESFLYFVENCRHKPVFNGDIISTETFEKRKAQFPQVTTWMLGRSILMNPFLPAEIKGKTYSPAEKKLLLKTFHQRIFEEYSVKIDNQGNVLNKMKQLWIYLSFNFPENEKAFKRIKKANSVFIYQAEVGRLFNALM